MLDLVRIYTQVLDAVEFIHSKHIIHRDLKPENILLDEHLNAKLGDFGWAADVQNEKQRQTFCGTYEYMAPEIYEGEEYDYSVDIWALGILLYEILHGYSPFAGKSTFQIYKKMLQNGIEFKKGVDPLAEELIRSILVINPKDRPNVKTIRNHPFILKCITRLQESMSGAHRDQKIAKPKTGKVDSFRQLFLKVNTFSDLEDCKSSSLKRLSPKKSEKKAVKKHETPKHSQKVKTFSTVADTLLRPKPVNYFKANSTAYFPTSALKGKNPRHSPVHGQTAPKKHGSPSTRNEIESTSLEKQKNNSNEFSDFQLNPTLQNLEIGLDDKLLNPARSGAMASDSSISNSHTLLKLKSAQKNFSPDSVCRKPQNPLGYLRIRHMPSHQSFVFRANQTIKPLYERSVELDSCKRKKKGSASLEFSNKMKLVAHSDQFRQKMA